MKNIIIDSDVCNEIDDQFAIAYALCSKKLNILAITICPHLVPHERKTISSGMVDSYLEAKRLCRLTGKKNIHTYKGCTNFLSSGKALSSDAVNKIIEICMSRKQTTIACLGTLTNVAVAIMQEPRIVKRLKIVWLGTKNLLAEEFSDSNYKNDKKAFETVIKSGVDITIIPSYIGKFNATSIYEVKDHVAINPVGKYLYNLFDNSYFKIQERGIKYIYDISVIAYLIDASLFKCREIERNLVLKEQEPLAYSSTLNYVYDASTNNSVWHNFLQTIALAPDTLFNPKLFFTSDTHFSQQNKKRSKSQNKIFSSIEQTDHEYIKKWNAAVDSKDIVYHLGDFGKYETIKQLNGSVILICGNYEERDYGDDFEGFRKKLINLGFKDVVKRCLVLDNSIFGEPINLTHKPSDTRKDIVNLYGHVHTLKPIMRNGFNVCTEYHNHTPVEENIIKDYLRFLHHHADNEVFEE